MLEKFFLVAQTIQMKYVYGVVCPLLIQVVIVLVVIQMNTGNGSFVGLGTYILGMFAIPITAVVNAIYIYVKPELSTISVTLRCFLIALITPFLVVLFMALG
ncbi:MAG: hypothetical protein ACSHWU_02140 [Marinicella sp.]